MGGRKKEDSISNRRKPRGRIERWGIITSGEHLYISIVNGWCNRMVMR